MSLEQKDSKNIRRLLLHEMKEGIFSNSARLPRETELSEQLGISRTQLRDALADLEREGYITRRHGVGTLINRHVLQVKNRMDIETEFLDIIRQSGYEPQVVSVQAKENRAGACSAEKLGIPEDAEVLRIFRVCTADGHPAIFCEDVLEKRIIRRSYCQKDLEMPIFQFLKEFCGISAYMDLTELHAVPADDRTAKALNIPKGTPVLNMEEVDYDIEGRRIFYSSQYFADELLKQTVLRKKL